MSLAAAAEQAALSIGRLDSALLHHPLRRAWEHRTRLCAAIQASGWDGRAVQPDRLAALVAGLPRTPLADRQAEHKALVFMEFLAHHADGAAPYHDESSSAESANLDEDFNIILQAMRDIPAASVLFGLAQLVWSIRQERDAKPGILHAAIPAILARRGLTQCGFVTGLAAYPCRQSRNDWMCAFLRELGEAATHGLARLRNLSLTCDEWCNRLGTRQKNSRLPHLVVMALCQPCLSPIGVQRLLGTRLINGQWKNSISLAGASKLLGELVALGILVEGTSRRGSHRVFLAADLGIESATTVSPPAFRPVGQWAGGYQLDQVLEGVDLAISRANALLARHGGCQNDR